MPGEVSALYQGVEYQFKFEYRDPWQWILSLIQDPNLANISCFHSVQKFYCEGDLTERLFDEPNTARAWETIDVRNMFSVWNTLNSIPFARMSFLLPTHIHIVFFLFIFG